MPSASRLLLRVAALASLAASVAFAGCTVGSPSEPSGGSNDDESFDDGEEDDDDWDDDDWGDGAGGCGDTPLVLSPLHQPVEYVTPLDSAYFDIGQNDTSLTTYWPTPDTPWLARDLDGSGTIDDGTELFGSETMLSTGEKAVDGFEALAELDLNGDDTIDVEELALGEVLVWIDGDSNRQTESYELVRADEVLLWIDLPSAPPRAPLCDDHGNCEIARSPFGYRGEDDEELRGTVIDITLTFYTRPEGEEPGGDLPCDCF